MSSEAGVSDTISSTITPQTKEKEMSSSPFIPLTVVLAKVKGYPPWPAMVLDESILPDNLMEKKPKSIKKQSKKKNSKPIEILPVRFFSDDTYIWIKNQELKLLNDDQIEKYLSVDRKRRKDQLLYRAYKLAKDPPEMENFVRYGSRGKLNSKNKAEDDGQEDENEEEEEAVDGMDEEDIRNDVLEDDEEEEEDDYQPSKKRQKKLAPSKTKAKGSKKVSSSKQTKPEKKTEPKDSSLEGYDSDWGLDEIAYDYDKGNFIFENERQQEDFINNFPASSKIQQDFAKNATQFSDLNNNLCYELLLNDDEMNETEVIKNLNVLDSKLKTLPKSLMMKSRLFKVLILIIRKPLEQYPHEDIKRCISRILNRWFQLSVTTNTVDELKQIEDELNNKSSKAPSLEPIEETSHDMHSKENSFAQNGDPNRHESPKAPETKIEEDSMHAIEPLIVSNGF
ncbi:uncharacterized protein PRCAT00001768001 [Priceomyces carsonii]|uniref:uncharacterized protein n=1 Tax=Priceomyces carsonii TaxID=28549 RepID=UPI002ED9A5A7|nr:unnamed protein product [Priceomyces carsonii]